MMRTVILLLACGVAACKGYRTPSFKEPQKLGGKVVPAEVLTAGARAYVQYCRACHGDKGDGKGPAAKGLRPPPRDFTLGVFKFAAVQGGTLPHDEDLERIVRSGLHGTAMLAWDGVPEHKVRRIIQYVKTFSPRWKEEEPGEPVLPTPDPWTGREAEGVARGRKLYHGLAQCLSCHPAYASKAEIHAAAKELTGTGTVDFRADLYHPVLTNSDYGVKLLPPDFTRSRAAVGAPRPPPGGPVPGDRLGRRGHRDAHLAGVASGGRPLGARPLRRLARRAEGHRRGAPVARGERGGRRELEAAQG